MLFPENTEIVILEKDNKIVLGSGGINVWKILERDMDISNYGNKNLYEINTSIFIDVNDSYVSKYRVNDITLDFIEKDAFIQLKNKSYDIKIVKFAKLLNCFFGKQNSGVKNCQYDIANNYYPDTDRHRILFEISMSLVVDINCKYNSLVEYFIYECLMENGPKSEELELRNILNNDMAKYWDME